MIDYRKIVSEHGKDVEFIKEEIEKSRDETVMVKASDMKKALGIEEGESDTDVYYGLRSALFDSGIKVSRGEGKAGYVALIFRKRTEYDIAPASYEEEMRENAKLYKELEADVPGLSQIARMDNFNDFDSERVMDIIREHKDAIEKVRSTSDDAIAVTLKKGIGENRVVKVMISLGHLNADEVEEDGDEITLWWD